MTIPIFLLGTTPAWAINGAVLDYDFASGRSWSSSAGSTFSALTTTRASSKWAENEAGIYPEFGNNVPAITDKGLLAEESRINRTRDTTFDGAVVGVVGSGGALPTNAAVAGPASPTIEIVEIGVSDEGFPYYDTRFSGDETSNIFFHADFGQVYSDIGEGDDAVISEFVAIVGGSLANVSSYFLVSNWATSGGNVGADILGGLSSSLTRFSGTGVGPAGTTGAQSLFHNIGVAGAYDFTVRRAVPSVVEGNFLTSPIQTEGTAATRAADVITRGIDPLTEATLVAEFMVPTQNSDPTVGIVIELDDSGGDGLDRIQISVATGANAIYAISRTNATSQVAAGSTGLYNLGTPVRVAASFTSGRTALSVNGGAPYVQTGTIPFPSGLNRMRFGSRDGNTAYLNGWILRAALIDEAVSDAALQGLSS